MRYGFFLIHYPSINDKEKGNVSGDIASLIL